MTQTEALLAIAERNGGTVTPAAVIDEARDEGSVLHDAFTWDDTVAAARWRVHEAQKLIRECVIEVRREGGGRERTYAFVGLSVDRGGDAQDNPYRLARDVAKSEDLLAVAERDALRQLMGLRRRHEALRGLAKVWSAIDAAATQAGVI